jgi:hypothetical protein
MQSYVVKDLVEGHESGQYKLKRDGFDEIKALLEKKRCR